MNKVNSLIYLGYMLYPVNHGSSSTGPGLYPSNQSALSLTSMPFIILSLSKPLHWNGFVEMSLEGFDEYS